MRSKLDAALDWAARGFRVFPVRANARTPPLVDEFYSAATTDAATIRSWWTDPLSGVVLDHNIGCCTDDLVVVDADRKGGKRGVETFYQLGLEFDTLTVRTPTGGYHAYHYGPRLALVVDLLAKNSGLDIRAWHGYVLAPGSTIDGVPYTVEIEAPIKQAPQSLLQYLGPPGVRAQQTGAAVDLDTPVAIVEAAYFLRQSAPLAIEGQGGDNTTYQVACKLHELGLSEHMALELMREHWNPRCVPPWDEAELLTKINNAWQYAQQQAGSGHPAVYFNGINIPEPEYAVDTSAYQFGKITDMAKIAPRPWLYDGFLLRRAVTTLVADGGTGKSTLLIAIAAHAALGRDFMGYRIKPPGVPVRSIILNAEDDADENSRRLYAVCNHFKFDIDAVRPMIAIRSSDYATVQLTTGTPPQINHADVQSLIKVASETDVGLVCFDPLNEFHSAKMEDNAQARYVMAVQRMIARQANVAVLNAHHTSKPPSGRDERAGNAHASLGAVSIINSSRVAMTLYPASADDCSKHGIPDNERRQYIRMDNAKANYSAVGGTRWMKQVIVPLFNGDTVSVFEPADLAAIGQATARAIARVLIGEMTARATASMTMLDAAKQMRAADPLYGNLSLEQIKVRLSISLRNGVTVDNTTISVVQDQSTAAQLVVLT